MALDYTPTSLGNLSNETQFLNELNTNFSELASLLEDVLSRSGEGPNTWEFSQDANGFDLNNVGKLSVRYLTVGGDVIPSLTELASIYNDTVEARDEALQYSQSAAANEAATQDLRTLAQEDANRSEAAADEAEGWAISAARATSVYPDTASGLVDTSEGEYFSVPSGEDSEAFIIYRHDTGPTATEVKRTPSDNVLNLAIDRSEQLPERVALFVDDDGNVPVWLEDGKLAASDVSDVLKQKAAEDVAQNVAAASTKVPLFVDDEGSVPLYLMNGALGAAGLTQDLIDYIFQQGPATSGPNPLATDGRSLYRWKARTARLDAGLSAQAKILFVGDSWTERTLIPQVFADALYAEYGQASTGWISAGSARAAIVGPINGVTFSATGWTLLDGSGSAPDAISLDMSALETTATDATISIGNLQAETITIYSYDGDGTYRYRVDGGAWTTVSGTSGGTVIATEIAGLADTEHTLEIDTTGNTGTARILGFYAERSAPGVEVNKGGNGSSTASDWVPHAADSAAFLPYIDPDVIFIVLGTNDGDDDVAPGSFQGSMQTLVDAYRATAPYAAIVLVAPPHNGAASESVMQGYADALAAIAADTDMCELLNIHDMLADYSTMSATDNNVWLDTKHLNEAGASLILNAARKYLI